jgi:ubiquitin-protein ligase
MNRNIKRIMIDYKEILNEPIERIHYIHDETNVLKGYAMIIGREDTPYEDGYYFFEFKFPENYPHKPPTIKFISKLFHPNVYPDGKLCISILHEGADTTNYEHESERWRPVHNVHTIFISIISLLNDSNPDSAANIDAAKLFRENKKEYFLKIKKDMENE